MIFTEYILFLFIFWMRGYGSNAMELSGYDEEVVYLPPLVSHDWQRSGNQTSDSPLPYTFQSFGRNFNLQLVPNRELISPQFQVWSDQGPEPSLSAVDRSCHYVHAAPEGVAGVSACRDDGYEGLILMDNTMYEVQPLPSSTNLPVSRNGNKAHIIRRASFPDMNYDVIPLEHNNSGTKVVSETNTKPDQYTIEIALFVDEVAYNKFCPLLDNKEEDVRDMLLAYVNSLQAIYLHKSLGTRVQFSLVRLTMLRNQPVELPNDLSDTDMKQHFCDYQASLNTHDNDPNHWDIGILVSGLDFYYMKSDERVYTVMGVASIGGVCVPERSCVITEFGTVSKDNSPYLTTGFSSAYVLAHEIGHSLGMEHDGVKNDCGNNFIMSADTSYETPTTWSSCSAQVVANLYQTSSCLLDNHSNSSIQSELNHAKFNNTPGVAWTEKKQCEILMNNVTAERYNTPAGLEGTCKNLICFIPSEKKCFFNGPALTGSACGADLWCEDGECVPRPAGIQAADGLPAPGVTLPYGPSDVYCII